MTKSFSLVMEPKNDFLQFIKDVNSFFKVVPMSISKKNISARDIENSMHMDITNNKIQFYLPDNIKEEELNNIFIQTREFIKHCYSNENVLVSNYENVIPNLKKELKLKNTYFV